MTGTTGALRFRSRRERSRRYDGRCARPRVFGGLKARGFDVSYTYHADAIFGVHFPEAVEELERICGAIGAPMSELMGSGGGEAQVTQRLRRNLAACGWLKTNFDVQKSINDQTTFATSHEVDHVKRFPAGTIALEIEWNNKDPFFDRDLENFQRLHADGAISAAIVITRGKSLQDGIEERIRRFAIAHGLDSFEALQAFGIVRTGRQRRDMESTMRRGGLSFADALARHFKSDKFGESTTHWEKLRTRFARGVGSPCPLVGIGIPLDVVSD